MRIKLNFIGRVHFPPSTDGNAPFFQKLRQSLLLGSGEELVRLHVLHDDESIGLSFIQLLRKRIESGAGRVAGRFPPSRCCSKGGIRGPKFVSGNGNLCHAGTIIARMTVRANQNADSVHHQKNLKTESPDAVSIQTCPQC